ncbi:unnamed protein product [Linum trigynum]|uniref:Uncharacterized protein n=1 Tax=Linum trigynum TaxID=586398 RepID=A0AAV2D1P0_9ROSI
MTMAAAASRALLLSFSHSAAAKLTHFPRHRPFLRLPKPSRVLLGFNFKPICTASATTTTEAAPAAEITDPEQAKHAILLERLRSRHLKEPSKSNSRPSSSAAASAVEGEDSNGSDGKKKGKKFMVGSFEDWG